MVEKSKANQIFRQKRVIFSMITGFFILCVVAGLLLWLGIRNTATNIDRSNYQAVFLSNGQVYFGKLQSFTSESMRLTDIYYLQSQDEDADGSENPQQPTASQDDVQLIKLGNEVHGPQDEMIINKDQVLFYENLKPNSEVSQTIQKFRDTQ